MRKKNKQQLLFVLKASIVPVLFVFFCFSFGTVSAQACPTDYVPLKGTCIPNKTGLSDQDATVIIKNVMNWLLAVLGFVAILGFVVSGIQYLTAAGDEKTIETAKTNMKYSVIGVMVALSGWVVINAIDSLLRANTLF